MAGLSLRLSAFKRTTEYWYPSYQLNGYHEGNKDILLVEVRLVGLHDGKLRVCVWGADDFGMERDYPASEERAAYDMFLSILALPAVTETHLQRDCGFVRA